MKKEESWAGWQHFSSLLLWAFGWQKSTFYTSFPSFHWELVAGGQQGAEPRWILWLPLSELCQSHLLCPVWPQQQAALGTEHSHLLCKPQDAPQAPASVNQPSPGHSGQQHPASKEKAARQGAVLVSPSARVQPPVSSLVRGVPPSILLGQPEDTLHSPASASTSFTAVW